MTQPNDAQEWFDAFFNDPINGILTFLAALSLVYLFAMVKNLADPGKRDGGHAKGAVISCAILTLSMAVIFARGATETDPKPNDEPVQNIDPKTSEDLKSAVSDFYNTIGDLGLQEKAE